MPILHQTLARCKIKEENQQGVHIIVKRQDADHSSEFASAGLYIDHIKDLPTKEPGLKTWQPV